MAASEELPHRGGAGASSPVPANFRILDQSGLPDVRIFASGNLDEYELQRLVAARAPIDGFGVGTRALTSADAPYLDCAYKLQEYAGKARRKRSEGKATWPGRRQVIRSFDGDDYLAFDTLTLEDEAATGTPLLVPVMRAGKRPSPPVPLSELRSGTSAEIARLPSKLRNLRSAQSTLVRISAAPRELASQLDKTM